jgi:hypothetical protein
VLLSKAVDLFHDFAGDRAVIRTCLIGLGLVT